MRVLAALFGRLLGLIAVGLFSVSPCLSGCGLCSRLTGPPVPGLSVPVGWYTSPSFQHFRGASFVGRVAWGVFVAWAFCQWQAASHIVGFFCLRPLLGGGVCGKSGSCCSSGVAAASSMSMSICTAALTCCRCCCCGIMLVAVLLRLVESRFADPLGMAARLLWLP